MPDRANVFTPRTKASTTLRAVTQTKLLTRETTALIRLAVCALDTIDGT